MDEEVFQKKVEILLRFSRIIKFPILSIMGIMIIGNLLGLVPPYMSKVLIDSLMWYFV